ncbi:MAG TPA: rhodanese-like domain-containing protein [Atribacterota bacterium]|nr:rhodanese-like domain-containing protein [Atribacterota bacterium]
MIKMNPKNIMISVFLGALILAVLLTSGCIQTKTNTVKSETQIQIIENITPEGAYILTQENKDNPNFVIIDVRTPEEFLGEHIENAVNLDYYSDTFRDDLDKLDKNKTYLIYCRSGRRSENASNIMEELDFREFYNMLGGIIKWQSEGLPTTK